MSVQARNRGSVSQDVAVAVTASALLSGRRGFGVVAPGHASAARFAAEIMAAARLRSFQFLRITAPPGQQIKLIDVAAQIGIIQAGAAQATGSNAPGGNVFAKLQPVPRATRGVILLVEAAEALDLPSLKFFERVAASFAGHSSQQLLFVGGGGFGPLVQQGPFPGLRFLAANALQISDTPPSLATQANPEADPPDEIAGSARPRRASWRVPALGLGGLAAAAALYAIVAPGPAPRHPPRSLGTDTAAASPAPARPAMAPTTPQPAAAQPPDNPAPKPAPDPAPQPPPSLPASAAVPLGPNPALTPDEREQLRRRFDAYLARAGRDTASLGPRQREALFEEYLTSRSAAVASP